MDLQKATARGVQFFYLQDINIDRINILKMK